MIEIVFSESAQSSLKIAQTYGQGPYREQAIGVIGLGPDGQSLSPEEIEAAQKQAQEQARLEWEEAQPMGGNVKDVYCLPLYLSMGDISEDYPGPLREASLEPLALAYTEDGRQKAQRLNELSRTTFDRILSRIRGGEDARIWYSSQPDEICGFIWLLSQLSRLDDARGTLYCIKLPDHKIHNNRSFQHTVGWGEISPGQWHRYLTLQECVPSLLCQSCFILWKNLQKENSPLRAVVNGNLLSVPVDFYDEFIRREISAQPASFSEGRLIAQVIKKYSLGISDLLIASRIDEMIAQNELKVIAPAPEDTPRYSRTLGKC